MPNDPARRARGLALFVILFVAVPSLLLTGLGVVAIENEKAAAKKRFVQVYEPVLNQLARRVNARMDRLLAEAPALLDALVKWRTEGSTAAGDALRRFHAGEALATNYFVIRDGRVLSRDGPRTAGTIMGAVKTAIESDGFLEGDPAVCEPLSRLAAEAAVEQSCLARQAAAMCLLAVGAAERGSGAGAAARRECPGAGTPQWCEAEAILAQLGRAPAPTAELAARALALARRIGEPGSSLPQDQVELMTRVVAARLAGDLTRLFPPAAEQLQAIAERRALFAKVAAVRPAGDHPPALRAIRVDGWRRVVLTMSRDGVVSGFEVVPSGVQGTLRAALDELKLSGKVQAAVVPMESPRRWEELDDRNKVSGDALMPDTAALLSKSELAWQLMLVSNRSAGGLLGSSRYWLYVWGLVLIVAILLLGIARTLAVVSREARLTQLKTDFVSSVSHDLRTPLTSIRMFTETLLLGRVQSRDEERECLEVIANETERLTRLTERILDFSRMEAGGKAYSMRPERIPDMLRQALDACRPLVDSAAGTVELDLPADLPAVEVDRDAFVEVLINLLSNAIKYSADDRRVEIRAWRERSEVAVAMRDHGIGMAKSEQKRIFERFYRVDCRRTTEVGGSGLGLSLVRHIVEAHHGSVEVESAPGRGSTFTIRLPIHQRPGDSRETGV